MGWIGNKSEILYAENKKLEEFVFANRQYKEMRDARIGKES